MDRLDKLSSMFNAVKSNNKFIKPGDVVVVEGELLGNIRTEFIN
jgi:2-keto-4-pentenoate hydratase/2-oxohepta-3-ene-1,7-dioic acid hydratase in catechol pathway